MLEHKPAIYMPMIDTADIVAERYKVSREAQDDYALESQRRTAAAQQARRFDDEIVPLPTTKKVVDKNTKAESFEQVTLKSDEGNRPDTTLEGLAALKPVREGQVDHRRQRQPALGWRVGLRGDGREARRAPRLETARHLPRLRRRRLRARRDGHRPGLRRAEAARSGRG